MPTSVDNGYMRYPIEPGVLYVVATPIGNLADITHRALMVLRGVDLILAEDTRHSRPMLMQFGVQKPLYPLHEHNEQRLIPTIIARLQRGLSIALVSDAGTPLISDPGYRLVRTLREANKRVVPVPGPSALTCALSAAGVATDRFVFEGFLPQRRGARLQRLQELTYDARTLVLFESPHRIISTVHDLAKVFGHERRAVIVRELTKVFETFLRGTLLELERTLSDAEEMRKGEFVILVEAGAQPPPISTSIRADQVLSILLEELPLKQAVAVAARITGARKNYLYQQAVQLRGKHSP